MAKKKKMSSGKKIAIGVGVAAVVGAILCYFYCPCFKKGSGVAQQGTSALPGSTPLTTGSSGVAQNPLGIASMQKLNSFTLAQAVVHKAGLPEPNVTVY